MSGNSKHIIATNYFGCKFTWLDHLYDNFPSGFTHLVDLFAGSFSVSINYKGNCIRTANDINDEVINFFKVLRDHPDELISKIILTPVAENEYRNSWNKNIDPVESARQFYIRARQSFFGLGAQRQNKGWHMAKKQLNAQGGETVSKWKNAVAGLLKVAQVLRDNFQIIGVDFESAIDKLDFELAFFYQDPPYPYEVRASKKDYRYEFTTEDHERLAARNQKLLGMAMVSSYDNEMYDSLYKGWNKVKLPVKLNNMRSKKVQEVIYMNYEPVKDFNLFSN